MVYPRIASHLPNGSYYWLGKASTGAKNAEIVLVTEMSESTSVTVNATIPAGPAADVSRSLKPLPKGARVRQLCPSTENHDVPLSTPESLGSGTIPIPT